MEETLSDELVMSQTAKGSIRAYFDAEGKPLDLPGLIQKTKGKFKKMDGLTVECMVGIFLIHRNIADTPQPERSFSKVIREDLGISRTYAYGILKAANSLNEWFLRKGKEAPGLTDMINSFQAATSAIGVGKLIKIAALPDPGQKFGLLDKALEGEAIADDEIAPKAKAKKAQRPVEISVRIDGDCAWAGDDKVLSFENSAPEQLKVLIVETIAKFYAQK